MEDDTVYSVDASQCEDKVWLVKVPNYLYTEWNEAPKNSIVAKIIVEDQTENTNDISYKLICNPDCIKNKDIPMINTFKIQAKTDNNGPRNLSVGSRDGKSYILKSSHKEGEHSPLQKPKFNNKASSNNEGGHNPLRKPKFKKKALIGRISVRCNVVPPNSDTYFALKKSQIRASNAPQRISKLMDAPGIEFKPKTTGTILKRKEQKLGDRAIRIDRSELIDLICSHFEVHQFYNIKDLIDLTGQPAGYVKEILTEIAQLSKEPSRRHMWELKPEYRHYT